ncbi:integral membrane protein [Metarhizium anisopliae]|nr:integral membrane protein [Metarhizium anisopliae]
MKTTLRRLLFGLLASTPATAVVQYCADDISQGPQFCVSIASFQSGSAHGVDLYLTIEMMDKPGEGWMAVGIGETMAESLMFVVVTDETEGFFYANMTEAMGNPSNAAAAPPPLDAGKGSYAASSSSLLNEPAQEQRSRLVSVGWHGSLLGTAFMILYPAGAVIARLRLIHWFWVHVVWQVLTSLACIVGVLLQVTSLSHNSMWQRMLNTHTVIGALLTLSIFVQLFLGYWHHVQFSLGRRNTKATRLHVWNGRFMLAAGMSNTGLGLTYAHHPAKVIYAWGILAMFEVIISVLVLPSIAKCSSAQTAEISVSQSKGASDEAATHLLEPIDEDSA